MEVLTASEMRAADRHAIDTLGIPSLLLMEAAGAGIAQALTTDFPGALSGRILVVCGRGNNGGDGLVVARHLVCRGREVRVALLARGADLAGDVQTNYRAAHATGVPIEEIPDAAEWEKRCAAMLQGATLLVDAILGTGTRGRAEGLSALAIDRLGRSGLPVAAVDVPSGLDAGSARVEGPVLRAAVTYTLCRPKVGLIQEPAASWAGVWKLIPIGIPDESIRTAAPTHEWLDADSVRAFLPTRPETAHKGTYGHLLAVAGSRGKSGAAVLVARAALRSGVGLVTVATPRSSQPIVAAQQAEVMTEPIDETPAGTLATAATEVIERLMGGRHAVAIGPGLGTDGPTRAVAVALVRRRFLPTVADADALNALAADGPSSLSSLADGRAPLVLTPHPGEAARLAATTVPAILEDRPAAARRLARDSGAVVVIKGHRTVVAAPDGKVAFNSSGNAGMATAGTGDLLTGMVGAFLARGLPAWDAARLAVFLHGEAGDRAAAARGQEGMIAADLLERLPEALRSLGEPREVRAW